MFTGRYPHEHGKQVNALKPQLDQAEFPNLGMVMRKAGYVTGYFGKWHLPYPAKRGNAEMSGFDSIFTAGNGVDPKIAGPSVEFIKKNAGRSFFLTCSFMNPHNICEYAREMNLPDGDVGKVPAVDECPPGPVNLEKAKGQSDAIEAVWQARLRVKWRGTKRRMFAPLDKYTVDDWRRYRWAYYRMVELVDREVGKILGALREAGLEGETVVIFASDHGDGIGAHRWAQKNMFYDECARVPFIVSQKGVTKKGVSDYFVNTGIDLMATVCDYGEAELPDKCRGESLRRFAEGGEGRRDYVACSTHFIKDLREDGTSIDLKGRMIRTERFKYYIFDQGKQREMLIDMVKDPGEMVNLVADGKFAKVLEEHRMLFERYKKETADIF